MAFLRYVAAACFFFALTHNIFAQSTTKTNETTNNTSACPSSGTLPSYCSNYFNGLSDHYAKSDTQHSFNSPGPPTTPAASNTHTVTPVAHAGAGNSSIGRPGDYAGTVSKMKMQTLLYPGFNGAITTEIVCQYMPWFGDGHHIAIGKNQNVGAQVEAERDDMISRGCTVVVPTWYGCGGVSCTTPTPFEDQVSLKWIDKLDDLCTLTGCPLKFALMFDRIGPITNGARTPGNLDAHKTAFLYAETNYFNNPAYWKVSDHASPACTNRPVVLFWADFLNTTEWNSLRSYVKEEIADCSVSGSGEPVFAFQGNNWNHPQGDGAYAWINVTNYDNNNPNTQFDLHLNDIDSFYYIAGDSNHHGVEAVVIGAVYLGFNDTNAAWGFDSPHTQGRKMSQRCGRTWLDTFGRLTQATNGYSGTKQIMAVGLVTWNDYEEGSSIETGIDNCLQISDNAISGNTYTFNVGFSDSTYGTEATVHHYEIFYSTDGTTGESLVKLADVDVNTSNNGTYNFVLPSNLPNPTVIYAKAIGKASIKNWMTSGRTWTGGTGGGGGSSSVNMDQGTAWTCSGSCSGSSTATDTATSVDGTSRKFIAGNASAYNETEFKISAGTTASSKLALSFYAYVTDNTLQQAINFAVKIRANNRYYLFNHQCDFKMTIPGPRWKVWNPTTNSWTTTSLGCSALAANSWNHFIIRFERTADDKLHYQDITINGVTYVWDANDSLVYNSVAQTGSDFVDVSVNLIRTLTGTGFTLWMDKIDLVPVTVAGNIDQQSGWSCTGSCTGATALQLQPVPSVDGSSTKFNFNSLTPYDARQWEVAVGPSTANLFSYDLFAYLDSATAPQALEFGVTIVHDNKRYTFIHQCDFKGGSNKWRVWNPTGSGSWVETDVGCATFTSLVWTHLTFHFERTTSGELRYRNIVINGTSYRWKATTFPTYNGLTSVGPNSMKATIRLIGDGPSAPAQYNEWIDKVSISY